MGPSALFNPASQVENFIRLPLLKKITLDLQHVFSCLEPHA